MTLETIMNGTKGFRAREAAANYKRRNRRLVSEEVRAARAAHLPGTSFHGDTAELEAAALKAAEVAGAEAAAVEDAEAAAAAAAEAAAAELADAETADTDKDDADKDAPPADETKVESKAETPKGKAKAKNKDKA